MIKLIIRYCKAELLPELIEFILNELKRRGMLTVKMLDDIALRCETEMLNIRGKGK